MKRCIALTLLFFVSGLPALAASLGTAARSVIPSEVQQIINVDYRRLRNSEAAMAMKAKLVPPNLKQFEDALKSIGVVPDRDLDQITLASFRTKDHGLDIVGIAQGQFPRKKLNLQLAKQKIKGDKVSNALLYPMAGGMTMTFLDDWTMLFGSKPAVEASLNARDNSSESMNANSQIADMIPSVEAGTVWSVLDAAGTQTMMKTALGAASQLGEYETVKKRITGSRYSMDFDRGVDFNLNVVTADNVTAATLSSLLKAGIMFKKMNASPTEKLAMENTTVDSDNTKLLVHFKADDKSFQKLLESPMFVTVTR
ncbi:MAG TPA: hypothetical protein VG759_13670 [Candidatus Angelobacter sp.]|jgi:hypothetical protein|nr:hypothetical protein [Candidatus Angelobacter sp.]